MSTKDVYNGATRSYVMSRIRGKDTKVEVVLRRLLWKNGLRGYRLHVPLPGTPDLVYRGVRLAIFIDGCFWHGCPQCRIPTPVTNRVYWAAKIRRNKARDRRVLDTLRSLGWRAIRFWEHEIHAAPERCLSRVKRLLVGR